MSDFSVTIEKRLKTMGVIVVVITGVIIWRMFDIQITKHGHYIALAQGQQRFEQTKIAQRGKVYAHDSNVNLNQYFPLAFDVKTFSIWVVPKQIKDKEKVSLELGGLLQIDSNEIFQKINNDKLYIPPIRKGLGFDKASEIKDKKISGVFVMPEYGRYYPESTLASHVLGFVNGEGDGKYGFEGYYNEELKGTAGNIKGEKDTLGRMINLLEQKDPKDGTSYVLTIDRSVQYFVEKKLAESVEKYKADSGTVVIMDVKTGGILAMAGSPSFDPNYFRQVAGENPGAFINPAIAHLYEPGSIMKTLTMAAAINEGLVTSDTKETFDWHTFVDGYEIKTAELKAFGEETMTQVLENSDNVAMVWVGDKLGNDNLYRYFEKFNLFNKTGIDLDTEQAGYTQELKNWRDINRANISFGQGIMVSPIEIVCAYAAIANGGKYIYPHIVDKMIFEDGTEKTIERQEGEQILKSETAKSIRDMLYSVVENGHSKKAKVKGFKIGAKTGTAQIVKDGVYEQSEDGLGIYNHSLIGIAPVDEPRYVMLVKLERPKTDKYAESTAAPIFGEISSFLLNNYYRLAPTEDK